MEYLRSFVAITLALLVVTSISPVAASSDTTFFEEVNEWKDEYNNYIDNLPGFLRHLRGEERINCEITLKDDSTMIIGVILSGPRIVQLQEGALDKPSAEVRMSEDTMRNILKSGSPIEAVAEALKKGDITYQPYGWTNRIKYRILERLIIRY